MSTLILNFKKLNVMTFFNTYTKQIPYLYFIVITAFWFTAVNKTEGITAFPILILALPFLWQLIKPNNQLNFSIGITIMCLSSYLIIAHITQIINVASFILSTANVYLFSWIFIFLNFIMALWIVRNSMKTPF